MRVAHELVRVAVAGDDDDVDALRRRPGRRASRSRRRPRRPSTSSCWISSVSSTSWISGSCDAEEVRGLLAARLVVGVELVAVRAAAGRVERDRDVVGLLVAEHLREHRREAVDRVRDRAALASRGRSGARRTPGTRASGRRAGGASPSTAWYVPATTATVLVPARPRAVQGVSCPSMTSRAISWIFGGSPSPSSAGSATTRLRSCRARPSAGPWPGR